MTEEENVERRRYRRFGGGEYPLRIGRCRARLLDWSAGGVGIQVKEEVDEFELGQTVDLGILNEQIYAVTVFAGRIQRIDPASRVLGIELTADNEVCFQLLADMLGEALVEDKP